MQTALYLHHRPSHTRCRHIQLRLTNLRTPSPPHLRIIGIRDISPFRQLSYRVARLTSAAPGTPHYTSDIDKDTAARVTQATLTRLAIQAYPSPPFGRPDSYLIGTTQLAVIRRTVRLAKICNTPYLLIYLRRDASRFAGATFSEPVLSVRGNKYESRDHLIQKSVLLAVLDTSLVNSS